ncbi:aspartate/glutamate racemase family protein [Flavihumibacter rivuli]|uniref:glutamate racemase n=1 Tax=Flavihumibacter rivuli TaxID=2838156 RepID=UPI001BDDD15F|nr:aspartate/glutamate racemase family protein [Flavihumibacter rivuli]ULQ57243.1 aspartate/glutamate racemase family protein [Flavihumibacter rivuli]
MRISIVLVLAFLCQAAAAQQASIKKKLPIGVFDSGTGGLTILEAIVTLDAFNNETGKPGSDGQQDFERESFQYLADQANMPYGNYAAANKTALLKEHILKNVDFFLQDKYDTRQENSFGKDGKPSVKMVVIACNTATAYAITDIKEYVANRNASMPVIGVIDAGVKAALEYQQSHPKGAIGVFATAGTVASDGYPRTLRAMAQKMGMEEPVIVSQGGYGLAESIDRDFSYYSDTVKNARKEYRGPSLAHPLYPIDTSLLAAYRFNAENYKLLCEFDNTGKCLDIQLNDPANYVRYHLVSLMEKMRKDDIRQPLNTLILGCTHYPYMKDTISNVLKELYNFQAGNQYPYRKYLADHVELIDPGVETAKEAYIAMRKQKLEVGGKPVSSNEFFISVPNTGLKEVELQPDGWFTYAYKYGRNAGEGKEYVRYVRFDKVNIAEETYQRFRQTLPDVYKRIQSTLK